MPTKVLHAHLAFWTLAAVTVLAFSVHPDCLAGQAVQWPLDMHTVPLAFPGAVGFGRYATGGRGGEVYHVTNLHASGPGSLYEGIASSRPEVPRTIVFAVAGTTETQSAVFTGKANLTIAGETAPGDGFCWRGDLRFNGAENMVIRNLRFRCDPLPDVVKWCVFFDGSQHQVSDVIMDRCTFSWSTDEMLSFHRAARVTIQYCLLHEWCRCFVASNAAGKSAMSFDDCQGVTIYRNVMAHTPWRAPLVSGERFQIYENVVYNQRDMAGMVLAGAPGRTLVDTQVELVSNLRLTGPAAEIAFPSGANLQWLQIGNAYDYGIGTNSIYTSGNVADPDLRNDQLDLVPARLDGEFVARPVPWTGHDPAWPVLAVSNVDAAWLSDRLSSVGPIQGFDAAEQRVVNDIVSRSDAQMTECTYLGAPGFSDYFPLNPLAVGGYPKLQSACGSSRAGISQDCPSTNRPTICRPCWAQTIWRRARWRR